MKLFCSSCIIFMCVAIGHLTEAIPQPVLVDESKHLGSPNQKPEGATTNIIKISHLSKPIIEEKSNKGISRHLSEVVIEGEDDFDSKMNDSTIKSQEVGEDVFVPSRDQSNPSAFVEVARSDAYEIPEEPVIEEEIRDPTDFLAEEDREVEDAMNDIPTYGRCILNDLIGEFDQLATEAERQGKYFIRLNSISYENAMFFASDLLNILDSLKEYEEGTPYYYDEDHSTDNNRGIPQDVADIDEVYFEGDGCSNNSSDYEFHSINRVPCKSQNGIPIADETANSNESTQSAQIQGSTFEESNDCVNGNCGQEINEPEAEDAIIVDESRMRRGLVTRSQRFQGHSGTRIRFVPVRRLYRRIKVPRYSTHYIKRSIQTPHKVEGVRMHHIVI